MAENKCEGIHTENSFDWERLLGVEIFQTMDERRNQSIYEQIVEQKETQLKALYRLFDSVTERTVWDGMQGEFCSFYGWFFSVALSYAEETASILFDVCEDARSVLLGNVYEAVKMIPIRCLISEIHECKEAGKLEGDTSEEEYRFYDSRMLGDIAYVRAVCERYPELLRLVLLRIDWTVRELARIAEALVADKGAILDMFCGGKGFSKAREITCALSDTHRQGQTVAEVELDNGIHIFYKPRSLQKEVEYQQAYEWFGRRLGIETYRMKIIERTDYGWEERVAREDCDSREAVGRYFYRLGVQLFLCYLVNGSDLHGENIMAKGEYPVIIDMETFSARRRRAGENRLRGGCGLVADGCGSGKKWLRTGCAGASGEEACERLVRDFLQDSVLQTGILPIPVWGGAKERDGVLADGNRAAGVNVSALHKAGRIQTPFRLPTVVCGGTSNISIAYRQGTLELPDSLPHLDGKTVNPAEYQRELVEGFEEAYRCALAYQTAQGKQSGKMAGQELGGGLEKHLEESLEKTLGKPLKESLEDVLRPLWQSESRCVLRHTQQYSMYLFTSLHPDFMKDTRDRIRFLHVLRKAESALGAGETGKEIVWQELRDMMNLDIPCFSSKEDSPSLFASDGTEIAWSEACHAEQLYFVEEEGERKLAALSEADLRRQTMLISYSLLMLGREDAGKTEAEEQGEELVEAGETGDCEGKSVAGTALREERLEAVREIAQMICQMHIHCGEECRAGYDIESGLECAAKCAAKCDVESDMGCNAREFVWADLQFGENGGWSVRPLGMNLYEGLPGVVLFFTVLIKTLDAAKCERACGQMRDKESAWVKERKRDAKYEWMRERLCGQMFAYTNARIESVAAQGTRSMGLFVGESSVMYAYLLLWEITENPEFLEYAIRHERIVKRERGDANEVDLLAGDAGCILCYLKLYECVTRYEKLALETECAMKMDCATKIEYGGVRQITADAEQYLEMAISIGEKLWERVKRYEIGYVGTMNGQAKRQKVGYGWTIRGEETPLAGMAHGNSGGIYAYAALLEQTGNPLYMERIRGLMEYEDTLYDEMSGNWADVRKQHAKNGVKRNMVAWCHGAAGILLSRLKVDSLPEFQEDVLVKRDLERAVAALKYGKISDNICLCHGLAGNYRIIQKYLEVFSDEELEERGEVLLCELLRRLKSEEDKTAQERNRVGLMCGLAGVGIVLCAEL